MIPPRVSIGEMGAGPQHSLSKPRLQRMPHRTVKRMPRTVSLTLTRIAHAPPILTSWIGPDTQVHQVYLFLPKRRLPHLLPLPPRHSRPVCRGDKIGRRGTSTNWLAGWRIGRMSTVPTLIGSGLSTNGRWNFAPDHSILHQTTFTCHRIGGATSLAYDLTRRIHHRP
jgi:hypothetical protein